jgi:hypothetical protein
MIFINSITTPLHFDFYYSNGSNNLSPSFYCWSFGKDILIGQSLDDLCYHASRELRYVVGNQKHNPNKSNQFNIIITYTYEQEIHEIKIFNIDYLNVDQFKKEILEYVLLNLLPKGVFIGKTRKLFYDKFNLHIETPLDCFPSRVSSLEKISEMIIPYADILRKSIELNILNPKIMQKIRYIFEKEQDDIRLEREKVIKEIDLIILNVNQYEFYLTSPYAIEKHLYLANQLQSINFDLLEFVRYLKLNDEKFDYEKVLVFRKYLSLQYFKNFDSNTLKSKLETLKKFYKNLNQTIEEIINTLT